MSRPGPAASRLRGRAERPVGPDVGLDHRDGVNDGRGPLVQSGEDAVDRPHQVDGRGPGGLDPRRLAGHGFGPVAAFLGEHGCERHAQGPGDADGRSTAAW